MTPKQIYDIWMASNHVWPETKKLMQNLSDKQIDDLFCDKSFNFGTSGVRAKMGPGTFQLNEVTYTQLAIGLAKWILATYGNNAKWIVGHDNRLNSDVYSLLIAEILASFGIQVSLFENNKLMPTPIISYAIKKLNMDGAVIVTASHNPKTDNGFKVYQATGGQILPYQANEIIKYLPTWQDALNFRKDATKTINYLSNNVLNDYFNDLVNWLNLDQDVVFKEPIIYSSMHGTASEYMGDFLSTFGFNIVELSEQCFPSPEFINAPVINPEDPQAFNLAIIKAETIGSKMILASDPDADRLGIAIKHHGIWKFLNGNQTGIIQTWYQLNKFKKMNLYHKTPVAISTFVSTNYIDRIMSADNGLVMRTPTGFKWIVDLMQKFSSSEYYINGFEEAIGGLPSTINADKDSFQVAALILKIMNEYADRKYDLIDILEKIIYPTYGHWFGKTIATPIYSNNWKSVAQDLLAKLNTYPNIMIGKRTITSKYFNQTGESLVWTLEGDSWIQFRLSGTEPKFKTYFNLYPLKDELIENEQYSYQLEQEVQYLMSLICQYLGIHNA